MGVAVDQVDAEAAPSVVIAHDFAEAFGGAERVLAQMGKAFPDARVFTILARDSVVARMGLEGRTSTLLPDSRWLLDHYRGLTPLYPGLARFRRLPEADVLLTSSYAFAHGLATRNDAPQVCYCHSPLRFAWSMTDAYAGRVPGGTVGANALKALAAFMRKADRAASRRVERYLANSTFVAELIRRHFGREASVLYPPVDCDRFRPAAAGGHEGYFLFCGRLVEPYKRPTMTVEAFRGLPLELKVVGDGPALPAAKALAGPNIEFLGQLGDDDLVGVMQRCAAAIFPSRDDLGLAPVEVMACGRPVLALAEGGALETVVPGLTGETFATQSAMALREALERFDPDRYDPAAIRAHAEGWRADRFIHAIRDHVRAASLGRDG